MLGEIGSSALSALNAAAAVVAVLLELSPLPSSSLLESTGGCSKLLAMDWRSWCSVCAGIIQLSTAAAPAAARGAAAAAPSCSIHVYAAC